MQTNGRLLPSPPHLWQTARMASRSVASTAERLAGIVEAAEQAASKVIDDAEAEARRRLAEAEAEAERLVAERLASLAELTDSLIASSEGIRGESERLLASLEEARELIRDGDGNRRRSDQGAEKPRRGSHLSAVASVERPALALKPAEPELGNSAGARLLATQMAVSGSSREEIEARLRSGFRIEDTASILDAILGPED
jgi:vacuolar-type H+-ATPase subunit H